MTTAKTGMYGMWSKKSQRFIFGIQEPSKTKAKKALQKEIGNFSYYFFWPKEIKEGHEQFLRKGLGAKLKNK
ncbi:hypothetical protein J14TS2_44710 [Bacillus sp. J14TS2]|uniref:hypothetical protein n=1 Tax=Bacillus sp. J14TS2 TaxID=2807188 RepID=UPI001B03035A|nr:hypothetical protein [Bacillus sp. J14TS2]GIN73996.1 hypothetical protein J14TS2_44710 [Bacillus sp. J14TS2]